MKVDRVNKSSIRKKLRTKLLKTQKTCAVSGWNNPIELQMAHIIPKKIGYNIGFDWTDTEFNCILLSNNLHALFDNFEWTLDIFSFLDSDSESDIYFRSTMVMRHIPKPEKSSLSGCHNKVFNIPIKHYASFYAHYYVYLRMHYSTDTNPEMCFRACIDTPIFKELQALTSAHASTSAIRNYLLDQRAQQGQQGIITTHTMDTYRVLWDLWSWNQSTWETRDNIPEHIYEQYENYEDPVWEP